MIICLPMVAVVDVALLLMAAAVGVALRPMVAAVDGSLLERRDP
jgi:hypothetical protein